MSYPGSKTQAGVWQRIIGQMPPHSVYVECPCGEAKVFWEKLRATSSILIDLNPKAIAAVNARLGGDAGVKTIVGDALRELPTLFAWLPPDAVVYCDPTYMHATRTKKRMFGKFEMSDDDHSTLLAALLQARCRVMVSHYPHELYSSRLRGWRCIEYDTMTRGGKRRECLWLNFDEPEELHDWRYAGLNHRQRYNLKRFVSRWLARIEEMPVRKRGYVLHELDTAIGSRQRRRGGPLDPLTPSLAQARRTDVRCQDAGRSAPALPFLVKVSLAPIPIGSACQTDRCRSRKRTGPLVCSHRDAVRWRP